ncbi:MAG TPA: polyphosphate kinase 1 [Tepidisphaeraceae bacterium]|jgi:polyphosphate kinase|nr:polyphosphate kinase 1 [Tepidisphaeraceae bacterium]
MHRASSEGFLQANAVQVPPPVAGKFLNRELSWLDFNHRVLELAQDKQIPLLERVRFLAIFSSNLDEFFMKRVGGLQRLQLAQVSEPSSDGLTPLDQLDAIHARLLPVLDEHMRCWLDDLKPALESQGVSIRDYDALQPLDRTAADLYFVKNVFPILTPLAVDPAHPFPFISNLSNSIGVILQNPTSKETLFVRIKVPENLPRWVPLTTKLHFVPLEQVIGGNLSLLFPGMNVIEHQPFRVTRNADIEMDAEDADDLLQLVEQELRARRLARPVRLELAQSMSAAMREFVVSGIDADGRDIYPTRGLLDMSDLAALANLDLPQLKFKPWIPTTPPRLAGEDVDFFQVIRGGDLLVHHPYEAFSETVEKFIAAAVLDPKVLAIKMTLYRTTADSPFVLSLIHAAESGKQVAVVVELKARFDEQRNVRLAQTLENAGVHVVYGLLGLKTHTKVAMVVRDEPEGLRTYCHIGTGNYNSRTAQLYTDLGLFTCNPQITDDVIDLFHYLTGRSLKRDYRKLLVAPVNMRDRFVLKIRREADHARAGKEARITAKMNALQDLQIIDELYAASQAGVKIEFFVRGFCCLRPGVPGMSQNIRVASILGRFLEHSRIYHFLNGGAEEFFIGSADWMNRNLDWRVEAISPVEDPALRDRLREILDVMRAARLHAWELGSEGTWRPLTPSDGEPAVEAQTALMDRARKIRNLESE